MKSLQDIETEIMELTTDIETNYPELYQFLNENPVTVPASRRPHITVKIMNDYLESLKQLLRHHIETRQQKS